MPDLLQYTSDEIYDEAKGEVEQVRRNMEKKAKRKMSMIMRRKK
jgi:hypothetical protein